MLGVLAGCDDPNPDIRAASQRPPGWSVRHDATGNRARQDDPAGPEPEAGVSDSAPAATAAVALRDAQALADPVAREAALDALAWQSLADDPATAQACLDGLAPGGAAACRLAAHLAMRLGEADPASGLAWAKDLEEPERAEALTAIATLVAATSPDQAILLLDGIQPGMAKDRALVAVAQRWVQLDARSAARWVESLPEGGARAAALPQVAQLWARTDPDSAVSWVAGLHAPVDRTPAAEIIARDVVPHDETAAAAWLDQLKDPAHREWIRRTRSAVSSKQPDTAK